MARVPSAKGSGSAACEMAMSVAWVRTLADAATHRMTAPNWVGLSLSGCSAVSCLQCKLRSFGHVLYRLPSSCPPEVACWAFFLASQMKKTESSVLACRPVLLRTASSRQSRVNQLDANRRETGAQPSTIDGRTAGELFRTLFAASSGMTRGGQI